MGTNFYLRGEGDRDERHIGKRSAAGAYCWDCGVTLCTRGKAGLHYGHPFHDACPRCGKRPQKEGWDNSTAGRELGLNKSAPARKRGVGSCSSFSWDMDPRDLDAIARQCSLPADDTPDGAPAALIEDEYRRTYTYEDFQRMLTECPIQFTDSIGRDFS
jgi:hypothetical protein